MTEREQLEQNTAQQYVQQRMEELNLYISDLFEQDLKAYYWYMRSDSLTSTTFMVYFLSLTVLILNGVEEDTSRMIMNLAELPLIIAIARSWMLFTKFQKITGELDGALTVLVKLGMMKEWRDGNEKRKVRRKGLFPRFKELFERIGIGNKNGAEAFA